MNYCTLTIAALSAASAFAANPITQEGEFLSDPAPRTGPDGTLYVFGSRDVRTAGGAYCTHFNDVFETRNLCAWTARRGVLGFDGRQRRRTRLRRASLRARRDVPQREMAHLLLGRAHV